MIEKITQPPVPPKYQRLIIECIQINLDDGSLLSACPQIQNNATIRLVQRLEGGSKLGTVDPSIKKSKGPCVIMLVEEEEPVCVVMPCSHAIHPTSLVQMCEELIGSKSWELRCPEKDCNILWSMAYIQKCGLSAEFFTSVSKNAFANFCKHNSAVDFRQCPGCRSFCERINKSDKIVRCGICSKRSGKAYDFCWRCSNPYLSGHKCFAERVQILASAPLTTMEYSSVVCPSMRACPNCSALIEHAGKCKHMACPQCKQKFCFVCLGLFKDEKWHCGTYKEKCPVAPRQTVL